MNQSYVELQVTSAFSFLRGASLPETMMEQAFAYGYKAIGVTDRNTLAGVVRMHDIASQNDMRVVVGCRLDLLDGPSLLAYPTDKEAYSRLSALLTRGNLRAEKGECHLKRQDVYDHAKGMKFIAIPPQYLTDLFEIDPTFEKQLKEYKEAFGRSLYLGATHYYQGDDAKRLHRISKLGARTYVPIVATNDVLYHHPTQRELQDVLTCVREKKTIYNAGFLLNPNAESHLKSQDEMERLYKDYPNALKRTLEIEEACQFSLTELKYEYPAETTTDGRTPQEELIHLTWNGAKEMFGDPIPEKVIKNINMELKFVSEMNYAPYFLTVHDIVRFARSKGILCQGRGSAANSTVCYCLGITSVDPSKFDLLFERFISSARNEPPDIDVDFEHERREEVIQYIYEKYGRDRAAIVATVTEQRQKGAIRDVGRAMGLSVDTINRLSSSIWEFTDEWYEPDRIKENGLDPADKQIRQVVTLAGKILGFPRQLGQHTGGFVITNGKLTDLCPILNARMEDRTNIQWNKDDIDLLGFLKIDVLGLGMLTCIRKCFDLIKQHYGKEFTLASIPQDDPAVYDMICQADTIGVFQIESRAQQSMLPRLKPRCFYDLVIEVAIVRPGPIQGDMVHPYLRRREGKEPVTYPSKDLEDILGRTLGVPLFQEQAMKIAIVAAGFTPTEADQLRRSMATFKFQGGVNKFEEKLINGMKERGYTEQFAINIFHQLEGFGSYGFPESHAASFALLVYVSSWIKCHYPDMFCAGLLNSQPMGFYAPAQLIGCAKRHGVEIRPVDINHSYWDNTLEKTSGKYFAVRLGFRQVKGLSQDEMDRLTAYRGKGYRDIASVWHAGIGQAALERLADADAFNSIGLIRRKALWEVSALADKPAVLFNGQQNEAIYEPEIILPQMTEGEHVVQDYASTSLSLRAQPVSFVREKLKRKGVITNEQLKYAKPGSTVIVCGLVLVRQRPGTAGGVCFMTLEDETGFSNLVVWESLFEKFRKPILQARLLLAVGKMQKEGDVVHVIVKDFTDMTHLLKDLTQTQEEDLPLLTLAREMRKARSLEELKISNVPTESRRLWRFHRRGIFDNMDNSSVIQLDKTCNRQLMVAISNNVITKCFYNKTTYKHSYCRTRAMITFIQETDKKSIILFIHGFTGGVETWKHPSHDSFPDLLLAVPEIASNYDVAHFEYFTKAFTLLNAASNLIARMKKAVLGKTHNTLKTINSVEEITEILRTDIRFHLKKYEDIIVIAHSMGGLIGKCCVVKDTESGISTKISLIITLATPHSGATLASYGSLISPNLQVKDLAPLNTFISKLSDSWLKMKKRPAAKYLYGANDAIVPKTSAVPADNEGIDGISLDENHGSICKPQGKNSTCFVAVKQIIAEHKAGKKLAHINYQALEDQGQYDDELFVLKLIVADIKDPAIRNAKEVFLNSEYMRKLFNNDADWEKVEHLYEKVRKIYSDRYISFIHGGIANSGVLLSEVHERIREEDGAFLACVASGVNAFHKQGMLHQLANDPSGNIWWTSDTGLPYLESELKKK